MTRQSGLHIQKCRVLPLSAGLRQPFRTAMGQHDALENLLFMITLANGVRGYGEAAVATHITGETIGQTQENLEGCGERLRRREVTDYLSISAELHERMPDNKAAVAAVEMALFDALARSLKIPLWRFFGSRPVRLTTDITIVIDTVEDAKIKAHDFYRRGFRAFKIKIGRDMESDLARVVAVSKIIGRAKIYLDANQGYSAKQALFFLRKLDQYRVRPELIEQPVPKDDKDGLKSVARFAKIKVCADESVRSLDDAVWAIKDKACDVINIKLMKCGLVQAKEIAFLARSHRIGIMMGGMMESALATTCAAQMAAGLGFVEYVDLDAPMFLKAPRRPPFLSRAGVYDFARAKCGIGVIPAGLNNDR